MNRHPAPAGNLANVDMWKYASLERPQGAPKSDTQSDWAASIYRGIVPAANIDKRDFAINGAIVSSLPNSDRGFVFMPSQFTTNNGYTFEVVAHWISSYLRGDPFLHIPPTPRAAIEEADKHTAWLRKRYPGMLAWVNDSLCGDLSFWK